MSEEMESPVEHAGEEVHEQAMHARERWLKWSALLSALFAVLAAVSGLQSAHFANDAMIEQIQASDQWSYYQAKGIKGAIAETERDLLGQLGKPMPPANDPDKYKREQERIKAAADAKINESRLHLERHEILSRAVTLFQVSIAVIAISVLTRRRRFLLVSIAMAIIGAIFFVQGML